MSMLEQTWGVLYCSSYDFPQILLSSKFRSEFIMLASTIKYVISFHIYIYREREREGGYIYFPNILFFKILSLEPTPCYSKCLPAQLYTCLHQYCVSVSGYRPCFYMFPCPAVYMSPSILCQCIGISTLLLYVCLPGCIPVSTNTVSVYRDINLASICLPAQLYTCLHQYCLPAQLYTYLSPSILCQCIGISTLLLYVCLPSCIPVSTNTVSVYRDIDLASICLPAQLYTCLHQYCLPAQLYTCLHQYCVSVSGYRPRFYMFPCPAVYLSPPILCQCIGISTLILYVCLPSCIPVSTNTVSVYRDIDLASICLPAQLYTCIHQYCVSVSGYRPCFYMFACPAVYLSPSMLCQCIGISTLLLYVCLPSCIPVSTNTVSAYRDIDLASICFPAQLYTCLHQYCVSVSGYRPCFYMFACPAVYLSPPILCQCIGISTLLLYVCLPSCIPVSTNTVSVYRDINLASICLPAQLYTCLHQYCVSVSGYQPCF